MVALNDLYTIGGLILSGSLRTHNESPERPSLVSGVCLARGDPSYSPRYYSFVDSLLLLSNDSHYFGVSESNLAVQQFADSIVH